MRYILSLLLITSAFNMAGSTSELSTEHICVEIAATISEARDRGELTSNEADNLILRCYQSFR